MVDIVCVKTLIKAGKLEVYVQDNCIYLKDVESGERVILGRVQ